jgi:prephenate dehydrogenase
VISRPEDAGAVRDSWTIRIVGAGLIGTSVGAALTDSGHDVSFDDVDAARAAHAAALMDGRRRSGRTSTPPPAPDVVIIAVPPRHTGAALIEAATTYVDATVMDTASVKSYPLAEIQAYRRPLPNIVLSHPLAGSASEGPEGASAALFQGRSWALCRTPDSRPEHLRRAEAVVKACGAAPHWLAAEDHDEVVAATSHVPQFVASSLASSVLSLGESAGTLSGPALAEMTRVADSPVELWIQIAAANAPFILDGLSVVVGYLRGLSEALESGDPTAIAAAVSILMESGKAGRRLLATKHSAAASVSADSAAAAQQASWGWVEVQIPDRRGGLAAVFALAAAHEINVEDVRLDHAPHAVAGTVALAVSRQDVGRLRGAIAATFSQTADDTE